VREVAEWLSGLGLGDYAAHFAENDIDFSILPDLSDQDLKDLGVASLGHRRKLLRAISGLKDAPSAAAPEPVQPARAPQPALSAAAPSALPEAAGERRFLTVMFCDLVGSTEISAQLDAEEWRDLVGPYLDTASAAVTNMGGHVAKKLGDGILALFGYPVAHENDAERAARAALSIQRALSELNAKNAFTTRPELKVRIGLDTGPAVVDAAGEIYGDVANIAARVQALAEPAAVLITSRVQRQIAGLFIAEDRGEHVLKGVPEPTILFKLVRASGGGRRSGQRQPTPLVGRDEETGMLMRRWERAKQGDGQLVMIVGEPGLGKSRLIEEFHARLSDTPHTWVEWSCSQLLQNTPLHPMAEWGRARFGGAEVTGERRFADLENSLVQVKLDPSEYAPLLAPILDIPLAKERISDLPPEELRRRQLAALTNWVIAGAKVQPVVLALEDLHWADPTTIDVLRGIAERGALAPLFVLATTRPEFRVPWSTRSHHATISLSPLDRAQVRSMVAELSARHSLPKDVVDDVAARTGGVPLFVEEVTRLLLERGGDSGFQAVPPTLQQSLMARLDRLGPAREVAQIGAVIGRAFSYKLLRTLTGMDDAPLQAALENLADAGILLVQGLPPESDYRFKHALIQDAAYENLLKSRRQVLHRRVAETLREHFADAAAAEPEVLAHHFTQAGMPDQAARYWLRAGERAMQRSASKEAIGHLSAGLAQVAQLTDTTERAKLELALQRLLGQASFATRGYASPEATRAFSRARELCAAVGDDAMAPPVLAGVWLFQLTSGQHANAEITAKEILHQTNAEDPIALVAGNAAVGICNFHMAKFSDARQHFDNALTIYNTADDAEGKRLAYDYGVDLGAAGCAYAAWCYWLQGYPDQALRLGDEALAKGERIEHGYSRARGLYWNSAFHALRHEWPIAEERAAAAIALADERELTMIVAAGRIMRGAARAMINSHGEAAVEMREALTAYRATGARLQSTQHLILLAEALFACGQYKEALSALDETEALVNETGERYLEAEIHRLRGNLLLAQGDRAAAERCYLAGLELAQAQGAHSLELRTSTVLARLWAQAGEHSRARELLAPIYNRFTEGFDAVDLKEAKALLKELAA